MSMVTASANQEAKAADDRALFGFWSYLMTDLVLFASLFATFAVLSGNTFGGPSGKDIFSLPFVLTETMLLLLSSFTCGLAVIAMHRKQKTHVIGWLAATFALGAGFLAMEIYEFVHLVDQGYGWQRSAFLSAFFALVGTHGAHILAGLLWIVALVRWFWQEGFTRRVIRRTLLFSLFWHFLDLVWIFVFTFVYLVGAV